MKKICLVFTLMLFLLTSCNENTPSEERVSQKASNEIITTIEIKNENEWQNFVKSFNEDTEKFDSYLSVSVTSDLNLTENEGLGTEDNLFNGTIDFNKKRINSENPIISFAGDVFITNANINSFPNEPAFSASLVRNANGILTFNNIHINNIDGIKDSGDMLIFSSPILAFQANEVHIEEVSINGAIVYSYDYASGLIGSCKSLFINALSVNNVTVEAPYGYLVTDASLIVRTADTITAENVEISRVGVVAGHYASGFALECKNLNINNLSFTDSYIISYPNTTTPNTAYALVARGLEVFSKNSLIIENVTIQSGNENFGIVPS